MQTRGSQLSKEFLVESPAVHGGEDITSVTQRTRGRGFESDENGGHPPCLCAIVEEEWATLKQR